MNRGDSQQRNWNSKKNQMGWGKKEILGLKGSILKWKTHWMGLHSRSEMAEEKSPWTWQITSNYQFEKQRGKMIEEKWIQHQKFVEQYQTV